ncbi:BREX-2 system adenine-specific DNA-methyltransferase PglX [Enemella evansiae]|uniref:BREX-2 system adenine-specific DNA-methyltransferase PglX n=1 Tax=Enemella evansiae TaxID=2016499 RepID=UPI00105B747D|nr:BREX-2 system adenine-specific DNA-methyltransferase PglX [Enemella evansiae]TDO89910.1 hypothetical protein C8D81_2795 [Enemella evansiae]
MTPRPTLTAELKKLVLEVEDDLRARLPADPADRRWREEHAQAVKRGRTAAAWESFRDDRITQVAVSWVLTTVFVRFCEDNGLLSKVWLAGPGDKRQQALDAELDYFGRFPAETGREWLMDAVRHLHKVPATRGLVDDAPLRTLGVSGDMADRLIGFWRETDEEGRLKRDFADAELSTRFLGDLYQDLSEHAKKTYALLQTPEFVEEFILDQTLEPALQERPLEGFRLIDPTCGSGHFLLGAFQRFLDRWAEQAPEQPVDERVRRALAGVHGVDKNPFAVAIARFRLTVAALQALGRRSLEDAPALDLQLAAGDSLLRWDAPALFSTTDEPDLFSLDVEDTAHLAELLQRGRYDAVVGNPPYITVKDKVENATYRELYDTCHRKYALSVPFMERFFELAKGNRGPAGWVGQITSNSFMKREFGSKLVEEFLPHKDLRLVVDTSGAYIPGHGTPTVVIVGRNQEPTSPQLRAILGKRGEPGQPDDPSRGLVWAEMLDLLGRTTDGTYVSSAVLNRDALAQHPWSLSGGSTGEVSERLEAGSRRLGEMAQRIGVFGIMGADDAMMTSRGVVERAGLEPKATAALVVGEYLRDYAVTSSSPVWFPYDAAHEWMEPDQFTVWAKQLWPLWVELGNRATFGRGTYFYDGRDPREWHQLPKDNDAHKWTITFAFVATHNHFVLDRGGKVFNRSAPVIKLPAEATEDDHLELLGVLNSSVACFWLKQNSHNKGSTVDTRGARQTQVPWEDFYEFTGTTLKDFPLPDGRSLERARLLDRLARERDEVLAGLTEEPPTPERLASAEEALETLRRQSIAVQEELDWEVYGRYGLLDQPPVHADPPPVQLGERAFEIVLARKVAAGTEETAWFDRHRSTPITEVPEHWPADYRAVVEQRIALIESDPFIELLERPEFKRRWATESWEKTQQRMLRDWLLDRLEDRAYWFDRAGRPRPRSVASLADELARDAETLSVLRLWDGRRDAPVSEALGRLLTPEAVPHLAALRLKDSGLRKFEAWQRTWDLQRREDAGEDVGDIPVPPKYTSADFRRSEVWQARGKLDVPKERFIAYPDANRSGDPTLLLGWAGWDHLQQAVALLTVVTERRSEGASTELITPLAAGLLELQPWVVQWHSGIDPDLGEDMAQFVTAQVRDLAAEVGQTADQLRAWRPSVVARGRKPRTPKTPPPETPPAER